MSKVLKKLFQALEHKGYKAKLIPVAHVPALQNEIKELHEKGMLDDSLYRQYLKYYVYDSSGLLAKYRSVLVLAVPQPISAIRFAFKESACSAVVPPTYVSYNKLYREIESLLADVPGGYVCKTERALLPLKLLAVRCGLGAYGRNNICYVPGMGSFHRLVAYFTDIPCGEDSWQDAGVMERCRTCSACAKSCPTSCISGDRFLIHAENCLTNFNENTGDFPGWVKEDRHNALVGCMQCQRQCPENRPFLHEPREAACFSEYETEAILAQTPFDRLPEETAKKLEALDLAEYYDVLPRNLAFLIKNEAKAFFE